MVTIDLNSTFFREKVYGCWLGKNCGGTLGAPLEHAWGEPEPFDVWWYPQLEEGGIPNDDLEMQLIWLKALEEVGPDIHAADLSYYWLNHIGYNWDEYGLSKTNLRLGLLPPISGTYNNWFKNCMGSPIRSEIWACVAPGIPSIAVRLAYEDAICDHAGGEGIYGELFNAAVESAAFAIEDREQLLDIGLSYIPSWCETARAISAARTAYNNGEDWKTARQRVLQATPNMVAQYSPVNLGFQVIGWLYGNDFGDALCKAVNCGYDTDCTGATLGSILGILAGRQQLPKKWTAPLGETISTNESWGGLRHASDGRKPIPTDLAELTERVCTMAKHVLSFHHELYEDSLVLVDPTMLKADDNIHALWEANPMQLTYQHTTLPITIDYGDTPACIPQTEKTITTLVTNPYQDILHVSCTLSGPASWKLTSQPHTLDLPPQSTTPIPWHITIPSAHSVHNSNTLFLSIQPQEYPAQPALPIVFIGAHQYRHTTLYQDNTRSDHDLLDHVFAPETTPTSFRSDRIYNLHLSTDSLHQPDRDEYVELINAYGEKLKNIATMLLKADLYTFTKDNEDFTTIISSVKDVIENLSYLESDPRVDIDKILEGLYSVTTCLYIAGERAGEADFAVRAKKYKEFMQCHKNLVRLAKLLTI